MGGPKMKPANFSKYLTEYLEHYLPELKNASENTLATYSDTFCYFLTYCQDVESVKIEKMSVSDLDAGLVERYLQWMETNQRNSISTRNNRLATIHSFVRYLQPREPKFLLNFQQILAIPTKKAPQKTVQPLSKESVGILLRQPDTSTLKGRRDATVLCVLYDTAARVSELCGLRIEDVRFENPPHIRITGKGMKVRTVPILPETAKNLKSYLIETHRLKPECYHMPLFLNRDGEAFTRSGIRYILNKYVRMAHEVDGSIPESLNPHRMRHTKAMHLYEAVDDLVDVRDFLGHSDIKTTSIYARSSLAKKKRAMEKISDSPVPELASWQQDKNTLEWLKNFGRKK